MTEVTEEDDELDLLIWEAISEENVVQYVGLIHDELEKFGNRLYRETQARKRLSERLDRIEMLRG